MTVEIVEFRNDFGRLGLGMAAGANVACRDAANLICEYADEACPRDTGALASTIRVETAEEYGPGAMAALAGDSDRMMQPPDGGAEKPIDYGAYVEFGTRYMSPQPFFEPAVEMVRPIFVDLVASHLFVGPAAADLELAMGGGELL